MANVNIDQVRAGLKERVEYAMEAYSIALENGFGIPDFKSWAVDQKYVLRRETLGNITQPNDKAGNLNYTNNFYSSSTREGELQPAKVDLWFGESEIENLNNSFMQDINPSDVEDINSVAGYQYLFDRILMQVGHEVFASKYSAQLGGEPLGAPAGKIQGGGNLIDGFGVKIEDAIASGEIPAGHVVAKTAVTDANVLAEFKKIIKKVWGLDHIRREMNSPSFNGVGYSIIVPSEWELYLEEAMDSLAFKNDNTLRNVNGVWVPKGLKRTVVKFRGYMDDSQDAFFSPDNNLYDLTKKGKTGNTTRSQVTVKVQEDGRGFRVLLDWKNDVNFADGRFIVPYLTV